MSVPKIVGEIATDVARLTCCPKRLRLAVTETEYEEIRAYMLSIYGEFYGRVLNVPLVVASDAADPIMTAEFL